MRVRVVDGHGWVFHSIAEAMLDEPYTPFQIVGSPAIFPQHKWLGGTYLAWVGAQGGGGGV